MFINIDHDKRPSDYKLHLAKPNKEIISVLHEKQNSTLNLKLGNISELNFSIPYFVEDSNLQMIKNPNIERIRELMYVKLTWGEFEEWFLIDNITESSEDNEIMNVQAFSIGYENKRKKINEFKETAINATEFYTEILKDSPWSIGEIDGSFDLLYRSFDESGTDRFELIKTGAETFGGVIVWDTNNKKINLKEPDNIGEFRGLTVSYDRLMSSLNKTRTTDEMVTRLYVYGNERITIENKNPTNEKYIEDYSYFMHPFKRDANKKVLESSYYMSDSLCHALLDNKELRNEYEPQIKTIQKNIENKNASLSLAMIELSDAEFTLMSAKGLLDIAKAVDDKALIAQRKTEVDNATSIVNTKKTAVNNLTSQIEVLQNQVSVLQDAISVRSFTKELIDELEPYIIEKEIEDARYIDEDELYEFAKEKFSEIREPRVVIETGIEGLMNSVEEQYYWDKLVLGDTMRVRQKRMNIDYKSRIIEMNIGLDDSDVEVKIANFTENVDNLDKFISILYSSESNSTILNNNKYKWDSVVDIRDEVTQLRESEIDATKKRITAGVNESVEIGDRGVVITTPSFPNEMIIMQAGVIALSEDGGETWKTSVTPRGVIADTIIGKLVASNNLIVTNDSGSMVLDGTGLTVDADSIKIMSGGSNPKNIIEDWNNMIIDMDNFADDNVLTPYEKSQILHQWNMISDAHTKLIESFIDNMGNETAENPYPLEYDIYLETYERLKNFLFLDKQSDGYSMLDSNRMQFVSPVSSESYRSTLTNYMTAKDDFILVIPMEYTNASIRVLEEGIFLEYVKSDELVASLNLSEEGVRIDGKLLSINSETRFRDDVVMDAGVIKSADNAIRIDLNAGTIDLSRPLTINAVPVATKEDIENIEMTYTPILSNDTANIPTDENGNNGNYYTANTEITIYQQSKDDTINWIIKADKSAGITGSLSGNKYTVTNMTTNVGYVDLIAKKSGKTLIKRFTLAKAKDGQSGRIPPMLSLSSTGQIMTFDSGNNPTPSSQEIQVVAKVNNYEGQVSWKIEKFNGSSLVETITPSKNPQNTIMINQSIMTGNITSIRVTAYDLGANSNFSDYITIYKLKESMDGVGIESITEYYLATSQSTGVTSSTSGFTTTIQTMTDVNRYLWNYEKIKYTDGTDKNTVPVIIGVHGQKGSEGEVGRSITSITEHYLATSLESGVSRATSGWTTSMQQTDETKRYLWNYETINWNKAPLTTYVEPVIIGVHGKKGEDGYTPVKGTDYFDGKDGQNGVSSYVWVRYSQNANGNPMVTSPAGAKYMGIATTTNSTAPTAYSSYTWSLIKGTDGVKGETGTDGRSSYMHIKYSDDGTTFTSNNGETEGKWIGILVDFVEADSLTFSDYTWNKVAGEDGSDAKLLYLSATSETMTFNSDNKPNPATQTITFTANLQNTTGTATFTAIPYNGTTAMTAITLGGTGNIRTLTQAQFPATATRIQITAKLGGLSDTVSVVKLKNGATGGTGADGKNAIVGYLTNENVTFPANSSGVVTSANLAMANGVFKVFDGLTEKTGSSVTYSVVSSTGATGAITTTGAYSVSDISAYNASITFRAIYSGATIDKVLTLSKSKEGYTPVKGTDYFDGKDGTNGVSSYLWVMYSQNANGNPMVDSPTNAKYIGVATTTTNTKPTAYSAYKWSLVKGTDGINGEKGANGQTSYLHIKYSNDGGATFTANSGETVGDWIGTYVDFTKADSTLVSKYTWNKVKGETGARGATGSQGPKGDTGTSVSSVTEYYLATASSTGVTSTTSGWTTSIQTMTATNKYLWNYEKINFSDGTSQPTIPVIIGVYGDKGQTGSTGATGRSITAIQEYYLATSASTGVTRSTSGWKTTMQTTTPTNKYLWNYEKITWSSGTTTTYVEPIIIGIHGAQGDKGSDGISPIVGFLTNESITLPSTDTGAVSSFTGATGTFNVYEGTELKNAQATYSVLSPSNITVSITQSGVYKVSAMTTGTSVLSGTATLRAVYGGVTVDKILVVTKALRGTQGQTGATGSTGSSATSYWITTSTNVIKKDVQNNIVPTSVTFSGFQKVGTNNPTSYSGRFIISTSVNGKDYTNVYTSSSNQTTYVYTVPKDVNFIKARLYQSGGTSILLDEQTIPVLVDAEGIDKKYEGQSLLDKTEILSGKEIFTDKADNSVVHVDIDGKSVGGGSGKNLYVGNIYLPHTGNVNIVNSSPRTLLKAGTYTFSVKEVKNATKWRMYWAVFKNGILITETGTTPTHFKSMQIYKNPTYYLSSNDVSHTNYTVTLDDDYEVSWGFSGGDSTVSSEMLYPQIELGGIATAYEPPAPTPDYPIEIHSLNDFDVVSSVGKRNLLSNTGNIVQRSNNNVVYPMEDEAFGLHRRLRRLTGKNSVLSNYTDAFYDAEIGKNYTQSIEVNPEKTVTLNQRSGASTICPAGQWTTLYGVVMATSDKGRYWGISGNNVFDENGNGIWIEYRNEKVEEGNINTPYSPALENITESDNHPLINKTNILLSEPLRSVGDVKDRLFRDNDGLWKVQRNVKEHIFTKTNGSYPSGYNDYYSTMVLTLPIDVKLGMNTSISTHFQNRGSVVGYWDNPDKAGYSDHTSSINRYFYFPNTLVGIVPSDLSAQRISKVDAWLQNNPITMLYQIATPTIGILPQTDQDKLNNIASYKDSNYLYTIVDKTNILPEYVQDNLKPTLHATFKGGGWYARFKTEQGFNQANKSVDSLKNETIPALKDGLLNSSEKEAVRQSLNVVSADKKGIDTQFTTVYTNTALTGTAKTNLNSAKVALNTAFTNLQNAINTVLGVGEGTRITNAQMTLVTTRLNEYGTALSTYNQRYEQAQDAITTEKKRLGDVYAKAQADLAETQAKAHADGKITAEEQRAIADAQAKLAEAKKYVDDLEIGGRNLLANSGETITNGTYNIASYDLTIPPSQGDLVTVTIKGNLASTKSHFAVYNSGGSVSLGALASVGGGLYTLTFNWKIGTSSNTQLYVYAFTNAQVGESTIEWIKLEKGNKATDWTEAPEDTQEQIGKKADIEVIDNLKNDLNDYTKQEDYLSGIGEVNSSLESYKSLLEIIERDLKGERDENGEFVLDANGNPINMGAIKEIEDIVNRESAIVNNLGELSERWNFIGTNIVMASEGLLIGETEINASGKEVLITGIRISKSRVDFVENKAVIAEITGQRMKINRAIFVESISVGEHKIETVSNGHTIWTWVPTV